MTLWYRQVRIEVSGHQLICLIELLADVRNGSLYGRGVVWGYIAPHDILPLPSQCQLKLDNVWAVEVDCLYSEVLRLGIEHDDAIAVHAWCLGHHDPAPS